MDKNSEEILQKIDKVITALDRMINVFDEFNQLYAQNITPDKALRFLNNATELTSKAQGLTNLFEMMIFEQENDLPLTVMRKPSSND